MKPLWIYLAILNFAALAAMGADKRRAIRHRWRIPERVLFALALLGGSVGATLGMWLFRHKTRHWYFVLGMPVIFVVQLVLFLVFRP